MKKRVEKQSIALPSVTTIAFNMKYLQVAGICRRLQHKTHSVSDNAVTTTPGRRKGRKKVKPVAQIPLRQLADTVAQVHNAVQTCHCISTHGRSQQCQ